MEITGGKICPSEASSLERKDLKKKKKGKAMHIIFLGNRNYQETGHQKNQ